ncbi:hypothetical protein HMPREF9466_01088 [Fusobacterium necrophorum subsp. funduliforme 1_1_36S]|nr:hypothetical protein HMPREF9466_01088 [Fusobacterium necrophorum subsp. funduliforme 1_1_36S]
MNGVREGVYKSYYANGQLEIIKNYKNGNLHGSYETFYNDGKISSRHALIDGRIIGKYEEFYPNGNLKSCSEYVGDSTTPIKTVKYFPNGEKKMEANLKKGFLFGAYKEYHSNGVVYKIATYGEKGKLEGAYQEFNAEGILIKECTYKNGQEI